MDSKTISVFIIDDEPEAINLLEMFLRTFSGIQVIGKETIAPKGLEMVMELVPDLIFLDIDMPDMNGLQVADKIKSENFYSQIVFTTAHEQYAYDALGIQPLDFLTKPFSITDLDLVIQKFLKFKEKKSQEKKLDHFIHSHSNSPKIKLPSAQGVLLVELKDIVIIKSKANKCIVYLQDGTQEIINRNLNVLIGILNSSAFFQTNRSTYINLNYLQKLDKKNGKCIMGFNHTTQEEPISRIQMVHFEKLMIFPIIQS
ncbi:MAG: LytTR family DNA-binding domain-containing protein [Prolixibacteraceae bacterium]